MEMPQHPGNTQQQPQPQQQAATGREFFIPSASLSAPQGLGAPAKPEVSPEQVQAEQMAQGIANGQIQGDQLQAMANQDPAAVPMIQVAVQMAADMQQKTEAQYAAQQAQGLGSF